MPGLAYALANRKDEANKVLNELRTQQASLRHTGCVSQRLHRSRQQGPGFRLARKKLSRNIQTTSLIWKVFSLFSIRCVPTRVSQISSNVPACRASYIYTRPYNRRFITQDPRTLDAAFVSVAPGFVDHSSRVTDCLPFHRLRLPTIVGFMITGVLIGPYGLRLVHDVEGLSCWLNSESLCSCFTIDLNSHSVASSK